VTRKAQRFGERDGREQLRGARSRRLPGADLAVDLTRHRPSGSQTETVARFDPKDGLQSSSFSAGSKDAASRGGRDASLRRRQRFNVFDPDEALRRYPDRRGRRW
jgi:hypothetical protein